VEEEQQNGREDGSVRDKIVGNGIFVTDRWAPRLATAEKMENGGKYCVCWREEDVLGGN
jgi:hypothetical protein